ncbi:MAG: AI-2E family transporter [Alphaproteobacteria bacterium]
MSPARQFQFWLAGLIVLVVLLYALRAVLLPFVAGMAIAYLCDPIADRLEKWGLSRTLAALVIIGGFLLLFLAGGLVLVPLLQAQVVGFVGRLPSYAEAGRGLFESALIALEQRLPAEQMEQVRSAAGDLFGRVLGRLGGLLSGILTSGIALINLLSLLFITPIVAFYLLRDWDRLIAHLDRLLPRHGAEVIREQMRRIDERLAGFVRGQAIVAAILGIFYAVALSVAGLEFGLVVGLAAGMASIIPFVGSVAGFVVSVGLALLQFDAWQRVVIVAAIFVVGQVAEGNFLTPRLVGSRVGLHPVWIIFALLVGGTLLGLLGMLLAVPAAAAISVLISFGVARYQSSPLYGVSAGGAPTDDDEQNR